MLLTFTLSSHADEIQDANKLFKQGQLTQALDMVNGYLANKPKDAQARFLKGLIVNEQGDVMAAISIFSELTNDYPELPEPYNNLAVLYAGQGQFEKAKVALEMAIRTHPSYATAHENLGDIYAKMASQAYDRALQLDKNNTGTQTKLALIRDLFGKGAHNAKPATPTLAEAAPAPAATPTKPITIAAAAPAQPAVAAPVQAKPVPAAVPAAKPIVVPAAPAVAPPAKAEPAPAPKPVVAPAPDTNAEIMQATRDWAAAWSAKNVKRYLGFYAAEFKTPNGETRNAWEKMRHDRVSKPKSIKVAIDNAQVQMVDANHASISFTQTYNASHFKSVNNKTLDWVKTSKGWQIAEERSDN
ncbi:MAG: tetratricopeptide repeat protein [Sideroxydans sp.]|nr:tetratricopeptide repeat protein [Sideroxydans sp.]